LSYLAFPPWFCQCQNRCRNAGLGLLYPSNCCLLSHYVYFGANADTVVAGKQARAVGVTNVSIQRGNGRGVAQSTDQASGIITACYFKLDRCINKTSTIKSVRTCLEDFWSGGAGFGYFTSVKYKYLACRRIRRHYFPIRLKRRINKAGSCAAHSNDQVKRLPGPVSRLRSPAKGGTKDHTLAYLIMLYRNNKSRVKGLKFFLGRCLLKGDLPKNWSGDP